MLYTVLVIEDIYVYIYIYRRDQEPDEKLIREPSLPTFRNIGPKAAYTQQAIYKRKTEK